MCDFNSEHAVNAASGNLSGNRITPTAKAAVVDASGTTFNFNGGGECRREPFLTARLRARINAKVQGYYLDSVLDQIRKVEQSDLGAVAKNMLVATLNRSLAHQLNLEDIVEMAVNSSELKRNADPGGLDPEWAEKFEDYAGSKYDEDVQRLWAKLLTGELNNPGSFSRKSLRILDDMEREDAEAFLRLCARCVGGVLPWGEWLPPTPLFIGEGEELALADSSLSRLKGLGIVEPDNILVSRAVEGIRVGDGPWQVLGVGQYALGFRFPEGDGIEAFFYGLTRYGEELSRLCDLGEDLNHDDLLVNKLKQAGGEVIEVLGVEPNGILRYVPL